MYKQSFYSQLKEYFKYHKAERVGVFSFIVLIIIILGINYYLPKLINNKTTDYSKYKNAIKQWEDEIEGNKAAQNLPVELFYFDPNTLDSAGFRRLGLNQWQTKTILNYRNKGGLFRNKKDVKKMYGIADSTYQRLSPFITISKKTRRTYEKKEIKVHHFPFDPNTVSFDSLLLLGFSNKTAAQIIGYRNHGGKFYKNEDLLKIYSIDSNFYNKIKKNILITELDKNKLEYKRDTNYIKSALHLELNSVDTLDLQQLYGIGTKFARSIVKYRKLLGGYIHKEQLKEVYGMSEERYQGFEAEIFVDSSLITRINLNQATIKQLSKHPYINFSIAKRIILLRKEKGGKFNSVQEIKEIDMLYEALYKKIKPYLTTNN